MLRTYRAQDGGKPVKVTLVWTDAPGATTGAAWVNNLDLVVEAGGQRYLGNVFAGAFSRSGGEADTRNNVESVYLPAGVADRFAVTVKGLQIAGDGVPGDGDTTDQDFALVVSNADDQPAPVLAHESTSLSDPGPGGDGDSVLESDEEIDLGETVRNVGSAGATGLSATLGAGGGLNVTQPSSAYPDLGAGATGANATPFEAELANASVCGVDVPATLDITTTGPVAETQRIALSLPTGELGSSLDHTLDGVAAADPRRQRSRRELDAVRGRARPHQGHRRAAAGHVGRPGHPARLPRRRGDRPDRPRRHERAAGRAPRRAGQLRQGLRERDVRRRGSLRLGAPGDPIVAQRPPYSGTFKPQNDQLSRFDGKSRRGTWTLRVRDLFEQDSGTLRAWGVTSRKAVCDFDTTPPDTSISGFPGNPTNETSPSFGFSSPDPGATFECSLDSGAYEPCSSPKTYTGVGEGSRVFRVRAVDGSDNEDATPGPVLVGG